MMAVAIVELTAADLELCFGSPLIPGGH
jgi:hypothetical protein